MNKRWWNLTVGSIIIIIIIIIIIVNATLKKLTTLPYKLRTGLCSAAERPSPWFSTLAAYFSLMSSKFR